MTTNIAVNFVLSGGAHETTGDAKWNYNSFTSGATVQQLSADLKDENNVSTGIAFAVTTAFATTTTETDQYGSTIDIGAWHKDVFFTRWRSNVDPTVEFSGLTEGDTFVLEFAGHDGNSAAGGSNGITVTPSNETTGSYVGVTGTSPTTPTQMTGTVGAAGTITCTFDNSTNGYVQINGLYLSITPRTITVPRHTWYW